MRIVAQRQPEMPKVFRAVIGLGHRPQGRNIDQFGVVRALGLFQQPVQVAGFQHLPLGQHQPGGPDNLAQRIQFGGAGFLVDPEQQRGLFGDQGFGGADIGQHHEFFDQPMRIQPVLERDRHHLACVIQFDPPLWQVKFQRLAVGPGQHERSKGGVEWPDDSIHQRGGLRIRRAVHAVLHLFIGQAGMALHHCPAKAVPGFVPGRVNLDFHHQHRAWDALMQRTQVARQGIGQHRHHPVGKIGRIAAQPCLAVQRALRSDVMGHIGDGDPQGKAAVGVSLRIAGVVMIAGIRRVDGDQRQGAQILAPLHRGRQGRIGGGDDGIGEMVGNAVLVDGNQAHGAGGGRVAQPGDDFGFRQTQSPLWPGLFSLDQLAVFRPTRRTRGHNPLMRLAFVNRQNPPALGPGAENADNPLWVCANAADQTGLEPIGGLGQSGQKPVACTHRRIGRFGQELNHRRGGIAVPFHRNGKQIAVRIGRQKLQHRHRGQGGRIAG